MGEVKSGTFFLMIFFLLRHSSTLCRNRNPSSLSLPSSIKKKTNKKTGRWTPCSTSCSPPRRTAGTSTSGRGLASGYVFFVFFHFSRRPSSAVVVEKRKTHPPFSLPLFLKKKQKNTGSLQQAHGAPHLLHRGQPRPRGHARRDRRPQKGERERSIFLARFFFPEEESQGREKVASEKKKTHSSLSFSPPTPTKNHKTGRALHGRGQGDHGDVLQHVQADAER